MIFLKRIMTFNALDYLFLEVDYMAAACVLLTIRFN